MSRSWTFGRKIASSFALSFVLLVAIGTVAYRSINVLCQTSFWVAHTHLVLEHVAAVESLIKDAETGHRGYLITHDEKYLEPFVAAVPQIPKIVNELRELTIDNRAQQTRIGQVEPLIAGKLALLKQGIELRRNGEPERATKLVVDGEGKKIMDSIRRMVAEMEHEER